FLGLATLRSLGLLPDAIAQPGRDVSRALMVLAMAGSALALSSRPCARSDPGWLWRSCARWPSWRPSRWRVCVWPGFRAEPLRPATRKIRIEAGLHRVA